MADGYIDISPIINAIEQVGDNVSVVRQEINQV